jgi:hypothetical protein
MTSKSEEGKFAHGYRYIVPTTCYLLYSVPHMNNLTIVLIGFVVLSASVFVGVAAAVIAFLVVGKKKLHQHQLEHMEAVQSIIRPRHCTYEAAVKPLRCISVHTLRIGKNRCTKSILTSSLGTTRLLPPLQRNEIDRELRT